MTMTLDQALALCEHASPMPHLAGQALRIMRDEIARLNELTDRFSAAINEMTGPTFMGEPVLPHPDNTAVDAFAVAMKAKLAEARAKGRGGWQDKDDCPQKRLSDMLRAHVAKGDPRDVANFAMFLHQRGEAILPADPVAQSEAVAWQQKRRPEDYPDEWRECSQELFDMLSRMPDSPWITRELFAAQPRASKPAERQVEAVTYFAADPAEGEFCTHKTLDEARADAAKLLGFAQDAASEDGWADEPPQICYGVVLGGCVETEGSRRPAPEGSDFSELVDFHLTELSHPRAVPDGWVLVPSHATHEMCEAAHTGPNCGETKLDASCKAFWEDCYQAMLAAAPSPGEPKSCDRNCDCVGPCKMGGE